MKVQVNFKETNYGWVEVEVDLEKEIEEHSERMPMSEFTHESEAEEFVKWAKQEFRHFYELGKNSK